MRLSDISSITGKKWLSGVFRPFLSLCRTASWLILKGQSFLASKVGLKFWCLPWFPVFYPGQTFCTQVHVVFERHLVNIHSLVVWKKIFLPEHFLCSDTFRDAGKFSKFSINLQKLRRDVCCVKNSASIVIWNINSITY